jgi:hypothetical protein
LDGWNDFVAVFLKDEVFAAKFPDRIVGHKREFTNALVYGSEEFLKFSEYTEDQKNLSLLHRLKRNKRSL